jgi:hypothetical protein
MPTAGAKERLIGDAWLLANDFQRPKAMTVGAARIGLLDGRRGEELPAGELARLRRLRLALS